MAVLPMSYIPDTVLSTKTVRLRDLHDPALQRLMDDMIESMHYYHGVGIAANQVGSLYRVCVIQMTEEDEEAEEARVLVNPEITRREGEREVTEGCLSLPGYQGRILRSERVWAKALDRHGNPVRIKAATELLAQALEHETDHLNGVVYIDHLRSRDDLYEFKPADEEEEQEGEALEPQPADADESGC